MRRITSDQTYSTVTAAICSSLSVVGSVYILGRYWYVRLMKARAVASKHSVSGVRRVDVTQELIHVLAWLDLLGALGRGFGSLPTLTFDQKQGERPTTICKLQAFAISFSDVSAITWNFLMAFNLYRWVCLGEDQQRLQKTIKWYILIALAAAATVTGIALGENVYGDAHVWCWISIPHDRTKEFFWKLWSLYFWIVVLAVAMCVMLTRVNMNVRRRLEGVDNEDARTAYKSVVQTLTIYILAFIGCWVPPLINRVYTYAMGREDFTLLMLHASIVSLQGFVNAVIYGKFHLWIARHTLSHPWYDQPFPKSTKSTDKSQREPPLSARNDGLGIGIASIFVTTFDMNWTKLPANLDQWVPRGKDLYAFTLLHCLGVQDIEQGLREHLLRVNFPTGYRSITSLAGGVVKGNVEGASICQMVFVNNSDVASGNFQFETADGRLWAQRKSNKNVLGIPIRYFDASIAFVACNLRTVSVSSPKQAPPSSILAAKHAATSKLVRSLTMDVDKSGVEFPHLYHHTFLAGDLNYDIAKPHSQLVAAIDQAYRAESLKRSSDSASHKNITAHREPLARLNRASGPCVPSESPRPGEPRMKHQKLEPDDCATEEDYEIVFSKNSDGVDYTELRSPRKKSTIVSSTLVDEDISRRSYVGSDGECAIDVTSQDDSRVSLSRSSWREFLDRILPSMTPRSERSYSDGDQNQLGYYDFSTSPEGRKKQIQGWIRRSQFAHGSAQASWTELLQHDELLQAIQAREILSGFEEPPVTFLPTFPRQIGVPATYSMSSSKTCSDLFEDVQVGPPAYADRILTHSLPDARNRIRNVGYWVCEDITTSSHRPVCSIYELEIDRFYAYKNSEASMTDVQAGNVALRDKTNVREFKIKLINLDANIWSYQPTHRQSMNPLRRLRSPSLDTLLYGHDLPQTPEDAAVQTSRRSPERSLGSTSRRSLSSRLLDSRSRSTHRRSLRESMDSPQLELVPIEPSHVVTVFPLPSEDIYALQRKVHEVAHSVQTGFLSSSHSKDAEEASLAFTNSRTVTWKEVTTHGVTHSAIAKPVNGVLHVAISVQGSGKDQGGQGILCINEADLVGIWNQESDDLIPFDIPLTWGGKHVGYLHGDIVRGL